MQYLSYDNFILGKRLGFSRKSQSERHTLSSMPIQSDQTLLQGSLITLDLYLNENDHLNFIGKVFSSRNAEDNEQASYEIEVTYPDLALKDRAMLKKFIDYLVIDHFAEKAD